MAGRAEEITAEMEKGVEGPRDAGPRSEAHNLQADAASLQRRYLAHKKPPPPRTLQ